MKKSEKFTRRKEELVERVGVHFENQHQLAPLAARIYASLILTGKKGQTFEELVNQLKASKSTVCTHLNTLQTGGRVSYFTKPGDRKRYFIIAPNRLLTLIDEMTATWNSQKEIHTEILEYKHDINRNNPEEAAMEIDFHQEYLVFLEEAGNAIKKLKQNIIKKHYSNE